MLASDVKMFCAHPGDGNSMDPLHTCSTPYGDDNCIPGCYPPGQQCQDYDYARDWLCSYPPTLLKEAMSHQLWRGVSDHNEVVVDMRSVEPPRSIAAVFYLAGRGEAFERERETARNFHANFLREFGDRIGNTVPLLQLDLYGGPDGKTPFTPW